MPLSVQEIHPRSLEPAYGRAISDFLAHDAVARLWAKDLTLWPTEEGTTNKHNSNLNWLDLPQRMREYMPRAVGRAEKLEGQGFRTLVFVAMGASNLAADTIQRMAAAERAPRFFVLDSIDPGAIAKLESLLDWPTTLFVFASKSGKTIETHALLLRFLEKLRERGVSQPGRHFIAATEENSYLAQLAAQYHFNEVFLDPPGIGGRFSSLIHFDLLLSAIGRVPPEILSERAMAMQAACSLTKAPKENPALTLAAFLSAGALGGMDRLFLAATPSLVSVSVSLGQLIGSSAGKQRQGIVPILAEIPCETDRPCHGCLVAVLALAGEVDDRVQEVTEHMKEKGAPTVHIRINGREDIGAELFKWELATALACSRLAVNPFTQPDAQRSREAAQRKLSDIATRQAVRLPTIRVAESGIELRAESLTRQEISTRSLSEALRTFLELSRPDGYVALMAFLEERHEVWESLVRIRGQLEARMGIPVQFSFGPRYLHALGQVYKGGPAKGLFVILTAEPIHDIPVPGAGYTFGRLQTVLATGDFEALYQRNERVLWLHFAEGTERGLASLESTIHSALAHLRQIA